MSLQSIILPQPWRCAPVSPILWGECGVDQGEHIWRTPPENFTTDNSGVTGPSSIPQALTTVFPHTCSDGCWSGCASWDTSQFDPSYRPTLADSRPIFFAMTNKKNFLERKKKKAHLQVASTNSKNSKNLLRYLKKWSQNTTIWSHSGSLNSPKHQKQSIHTIVSNPCIREDWTHFISNKLNMSR